MKVLGQKRRALWDVDRIEIFQAADEENPMRMCGLKAETFIGSWVRPSGPKKYAFVVLGVYDFARCKEVLEDITTFFQLGGRVYEMPEE